MEKCALIGLFLLCLFQSNGQNFRHLDYLGAGHQNEMKVTGSSASNGTQLTQTIDGFDIKSTEQLKDASRFLAQATFGADMATIKMTAAMGYEAWLEEQFVLPYVPMLEEYLRHGTLFGDDDEVAEGRYSDYIFGTAWMDNALSTADILRQRIAWSLSQLMVINNKSDLFEDFGDFSVSYYDRLLENSFKNYRSLIYDVTMSPTMGIFLSHYNNPKANPILNTRPDENYAREIMQLFSIGLWELNPDGTRKYDSQGQFIPTYSNQDIKQFARVFTGLGGGAPNDEFGFNLLEADLNLTTARSPMRMYDAYHDMDAKTLLNGYQLAAGQTGMQDINMTLDHLSTHPNTAPFISLALIKFLTTSNPSPAYVARVSAVFNPMEENNFQKVITAILLDPEARASPNKEVYSFGKLREPLLRYLNYLRALPLSPGPNDTYVFEYECMEASIAQRPLGAPSVFNFFLPEYQPPGQITQRYMVAPEFQILNSTTSVGYINEMDKLTIRRGYLLDCVLNEQDDLDLINENDAIEDTYYMDYRKELELATQNDRALIDHFDILLANGLLTEKSKQIIENAISQLAEPTDKIRMASYLIMISPDYVILK